VDGRRTADRTAGDHVGSPSWSGHREARAGASRAWNPDSPYAVHRSEEGTFPTERSVALLILTFLAYPVLVASAVASVFPLPVRFVVAGCAVGVVAYLQSRPAVGAVVFGAWTVLGPAALVALDVSLLSVAGWLVAVATAAPFGLSVLTWLALR
jgi:hypothetical protein